MKTQQRQAVKTTKYPLANFNGVEVFLTVPTAGAKEQKYYLDYVTEVREKYYGKGVIKKKAIDFFSSIANLSLKRSVIVAMLTELFKSELDAIKNDLIVKKEPQEVFLNSNVGEALRAFYTYKQLQRKEGTISKTSMYGYKHHQLKLEAYFKLPQHSKTTLVQLDSTFWSNYRLSLLENTYSFGKKRLMNSSVQLHFQYVKQFYVWLMDFKGLAIKNHLKQLNALPKANLQKRFKVIPDALLSEFYHILETHEKYYYTRLYLSALFLYENNIRLSEQVLIKAGDIDLQNGLIRIINQKNDSVRTVSMSPKVKELIIIIQQNTTNAGLPITDDMYLIGGHNMFKDGIPQKQTDLCIVMRRFRKKYVQFAGRTLYEHKHTSITHQFNSGIEPYQIKQRANHSSISTTEIYLQSYKVINPYEFKDTSK